MKQHFSISLEAAPDLLYFTAHSHHLWPDVTRAAHLAAWDLAAERKDEKWSVVFGEVIPACQEHIARTLSLSDPKAIAFAPNTHELAKRVLSCVDDRRPVRVLTTDGEFHSFRRQLARLELAGRVEVERVPLEPFASLAQRLEAAIARGGWDLVYFSQVFFNTGLVLENLAELVAAVRDDSTYVVIDGYHGFMARPTDLSGVESRAFYMAGGYKYAMSGEGACFLHCPPGYAERPVDTGWFASFGDLETTTGDAVPYSSDGFRMWGSTFDPTAFFRFRAAMDLWREQGIDVSAIHDHVRRLQARFLERIDGEGIEGLNRSSLVPGAELAARANFLTFQCADAERVHRALREAGVVTDVRGDKLRLGFGIYHDEEDVDELARRALGSG